jgi:N-acetylglutamate synthase-like GNAT family acetyltransferase
VSGHPGFRVSKAWGFLVVDPNDDEEGFAAFHAADDNGVVAVLPMVATDEERLALLRPLAVQHAAASGRSVRLVEFTGMRELAVIHPPAKRGRG